MTKFRRNSKIKREHGMISGLDAYLASIESWPEIDAILSGVITRRKGTSPFEFRVQYQPSTGLKCLAKNQGVVQEVFIVTKEPTKLQRRLFALRHDLPPEHDTIKAE